MVAITIPNSMILSVSGISFCLQLALSAPDTQYLRAPYSRILEDDTCKILEEEETSPSRRLHSKGFSVLQNTKAFHHHTTDDFVEFEEDERNLLNWIGGAAYDDEITDFLQNTGADLIDDDDWLSQLPPSKRPEDDAMLGLYDTGGPSRTINDEIEAAFVDAQNIKIANLIDDDDDDNDDDEWLSQLVPWDLIDDDDWFPQLEPPEDPTDDDIVSIFDTGSSLIIEDQPTFMIKGPSDSPDDEDNTQTSNVDKNSPPDEDNDGSGSSTGSTGDDIDSEDTIDNTSPPVDSGTDNLSDSADVDGSLGSTVTENGVESTANLPTSLSAETSNVRKQKCENNMNGRWVTSVVEIKCDGEAVENSVGICVSKSCSDDDTSKFISEIEKQAAKGSSNVTDDGSETKCEYTFLSGSSPLRPGNMALTTSALLLAWYLF